MKTLDFILPAKNADSAPDLHTSSFSRRAAKPSEPFDKMMNRALTKPAPESTKPATDKKPAAQPNAFRKATANSNAPTTTIAASAADTGNCDTAAAHENDSASPPESEESTASEKPERKRADSTATENSPALEAIAATLAPVPTPVAPAQTPQTFSSAPEIVPVATATESATEISSAISGIPETIPASSTSDAKPAKSESDGKNVPIQNPNPANSAVSNKETPVIQTAIQNAWKPSETPVKSEDGASPKLRAFEVDAAGTSAAEQRPNMNQPEQTAKTDAVSDQSLRGVTVASAIHAAARPKPAAKQTRVEATDSPAPVSAAMDHSASAAETSSSNLISASSQTEMRVRALDRTHDIVAFHGLQLKGSSSDSLQVVIKPGAGLQLSLEMKQTADGIEAQAVLQQGNFADLNKHWAELQQRLEERGIRLAPLGNDSAAMNQGKEHFQRQSNQSSQPDAVTAGAFAEFASASAASGGTRFVTTPSRGWESWA